MGTAAATTAVIFVATVTALAPLPRDRPVQVVVDIDDTVKSSGNARLLDARRGARINQRLHAIACCVAWRACCAQHSPSSSKFFGDGRARRVAEPVWFL